MTDPASIADLHERLHVSFELTPEHTATFTLDRQLAQWRAETPPERQAALQAEWDDPDAALEHARVKHGFGTPQFRAAARAIGFTAATRGSIGEM